MNSMWQVRRNLEMLPDRSHPVVTRVNRHVLATFPPYRALCGSMKQISPTINRIGYVAFTLLGIVKPIMSHDFSEATTLGIALIFDPFDPDVPLTQRPWWQQGLLYTQMAVALTAIGVMLFK